MSYIQYITQTTAELLPTSPVTNSQQFTKTIGSFPNNSGAFDVSARSDLSNQLTLYVSPNLGSLTSISLNIQFSNDGVNWYNETLDDTSSATGSVTERTLTRLLTESVNKRIPIKIIDNFIRVGYSGLGTSTGSSLKIVALIAVV